jgi:hypothetical protein
LKRLLKKAEVVNPRQAGRRLKAKTKDPMGTKRVNRYKLTPIPMPPKAIDSLFPVLKFSV